MINKIKIKRISYYNLDGTLSSDNYKVTVCGAQTQQDMNVYAEYRDKTFDDYKAAREHIRKNKGI